ASSSLASAEKAALIAESPFDSPSFQSQSHALSLPNGFAFQVPMRSRISKPSATCKQKRLSVPARRDVHLIATPLIIIRSRRITLECQMQTTIGKSSAVPVNFYVTDVTIHKAYDVFGIRVRKRHASGKNCVVPRPRDKRRSLHDEKRLCRVFNRTQLPASQPGRRPRPGLRHSGF